MPPFRKKPIQLPRPHVACFYHQRCAKSAFCVRRRANFAQVMPTLSRPYTNRRRVRPIPRPAGRYRAPRRNEIPCGREFFPFGAEICRLSLFRTETWAIGQPVSRGGNRELGRPEQRTSNAEQGIKNAEQGIKNAHCRASSCVSNGAVCSAIAAILAAFMPALEDNDGSGSWTVSISALTRFAA